MSEEKPWYIAMRDNPNEHLEPAWFDTYGEPEAKLDWIMVITDMTEDDIKARLAARKKEKPCQD